jgi:hypothetical protein
MTHADGSRVVITDLKNIDERLDLWAGILTSSFEVDGVPVHVETAVHPDRDEVAVSIDSPLIASGRLKVRIAFPYASHSFGPDYQDWTHPEAHTTVMTRRGRPAPTSTAPSTRRTTPSAPAGRPAHRSPRPASINILLSSHTDRASSSRHGFRPAESPPSQTPSPRSNPPRARTGSTTG